MTFTTLNDVDVTLNDVDAGYDVFVEKRACINATLQTDEFFGS